MALLDFSCCDRMCNLLWFLWLLGILYVKVEGQTCACQLAGGCNFTTFCLPAGNCRKRNVAVGKQATMSSVFNSRQYDEVSGPACLAVNGNEDIIFRPINRFPSSPNCIHTASEDMSQFWEVDLGQQFAIVGVTVIGRDKKVKTKSHMRLLVDNSERYVFPPNNDLPRTEILFKESVRGRMVRLTQGTPVHPDVHPFIILCEVQVWACVDGYYGSDCSKRCGTCQTPSSCDGVTGICTAGCDRGWQGPRCDETCPGGKYGNDCSQTCGNCRQDTVCNRTDGRCESGCADGFTGDRCDEACDYGYFGTDCAKRCGGCNSNASCDAFTGYCPAGCESGWQGFRCDQTCSAGTYGNACMLKCGNCSVGTVCHPRDGRCESGCAEGFLGHKCDEACPEGTYGMGCAWACGNCSKDTPCDPTDGKCQAGCADGFEGDRCDQACVDGFFGPDCGKRCGACNSNSSCDTVTGYCPAGCESGWQGAKCDQACPAGTYGNDCTMTCGKCSKDAVCNHRDGRCESGCSDGFHGDWCDEALRKDYFVGPVAGGVAGGVVILISGVVVIYLWVKRRSDPQEDAACSSEALQLTETNPEL